MWHLLEKSTVCPRSGLDSAGGASARASERAAERRAMTKRPKKVVRKERYLSKIRLDCSWHWYCSNPILLPEPIGSPTLD